MAVDGLEGCPRVKWGSRRRRRRGTGLVAECENKKGDMERDIWEEKRVCMKKRGRCGKKHERIVR